MNTVYKFISFVIGTFVLLALMVYLIVLTNHTLNDTSDNHVVSFSGQGKVLAKPDVAVTSFSIVTEGATSKQAQDKNSERSKTVVDFLKKQKISDKDIKTSGYNIYPTYSYPQFGTPRISGYQVNQSIEVKIRDLDRVNIVIDGIVNAGVNQVNQVTFQIDEPEKLKVNARKLAIEDAKSKAKELEKQLNVDIGKLVTFSEDVGGNYPPMFYDSAKGRVGIGGGGPTPELPAGENEVVVNITLTYQLR